MNVIEGPHHGREARFGVVVSKFNDFVTEKLLHQTLKVLQKSGVPEEHIQVVKVPGAFEIPCAARQVALSGEVDAVICLGAVIRGETPHFEYICAETSRGIGHVALETGIPTIFGVLTTETVEQALERAQAPERNRGAQAARAALEMAGVMRRLRASPA